MEVLSTRAASVADVGLLSLSSKDTEATAKEIHALQNQIALQVSLRLHVYSSST
jgi:hypothetical protein